RRSTGAAAIATLRSGVSGAHGRPGHHRTGRPVTAPTPHTPLSQTCTQPRAARDPPAPCSSLGGLPESLLNPPRGLASDARHRRQLVEGGFLHGLQAPELLQERSPLRRPDPRDLVEGARQGALLPALSVAGDGEAVRFVADLLDEV